MINADRWKAEQRDWLLEELRSLISKWIDESSSDKQQFIANEESDKIAKARTGGCARELGALLGSIK